MLSKSRSTAPGGPETVKLAEWSKSLARCWASIVRNITPSAAPASGPVATLTETRGRTSGRMRICVDVWVDSGSAGRSRSERSGLTSWCQAGSVGALPGHLLFTVRDESTTQCEHYSVSDYSDKAANVLQTASANSGRQYAAAPGSLLGGFKSRHPDQGRPSSTWGSSSSRGWFALRALRRRSCSNRGGLMSGIFRNDSEAELDEAPVSATRAAVTLPQLQPAARRFECMFNWESPRIRRLGMLAIRAAPGSTKRCAAGCSRRRHARRRHGRPATAVSRVVCRWRPVRRGSRALPGFGGQAAG